MKPRTARKLEKCNTSCMKTYSGCVIKKTAFIAGNYESFTRNRWIQKITD